MIFRKGLPEVLLMIILVLVFFQLDLITNNMVRGVVVSTLMISFADIVIKIVMKLWKFINIELIIIRMEKKYIAENYKSYRENLSQSQNIRDTTMQELIAGLGLESLGAIRKRLAERAMSSGTKKKKKYLSRQIKEVEKKISKLKVAEKAGDVLAEVLSEKAVDGKELIEKGVKILNEALPKADAAKVQEIEKKRKKNKK